MKQHYEKVITLCCFLFLFTNVGLTSTSFNVYQPYIIATDGVGDVGGSLILSIRTLTSLLTIIFVDRYYHALDVRLGVFLASLMTTAGFVIYGFAGNLGGFVAGAIFAGAGYGLGGMVGMTLLISRWFDHGLGGAVGFASLGSGFASILVPLAAVRIIDGQSLQLSFRLEALLALTLGLLVFALLRNRPSDVNAEMKQKNAAKGEPGNRSNRENERAGDPEIPPRHRKILLAAMMCVGCMSVGGDTYYSVLLTTNGFDPRFAAFTLSLLGFALTASKMITGKMFDRFGVERSSSLVFLTLIIGFACSCFTPCGSSALGLFAALLIGWGTALGTVGLSVWSLQLADPANREKSIKNAQVAYSLGGFLINAIPGPLRVATGTYVSTYLILFAMAVFASVTVISIYKRYRPDR